MFNNLLENIKTLQKNFHSFKIKANNLAKEWGNNPRIHDQGNIHEKMIFLGK